jgi:multidrug efflux pump subunit AcrB
VLRGRGASHVYSYWSWMPMPAVQAETIPPESQPLNVIRLLLPPGTRYEQQREAFRPFDRIQAPDPEMRAQVATLARRSAAVGRDGFVLANNKAEGSSPLTVMEIARIIAGAEERRNVGT